MSKTFNTKTLAKGLGSKFEQPKKKVEYLKISALVKSDNLQYKKIKIKSFECPKSIRNYKKK